MNASKSFLKLTFHSCCFVLMRDLLNQNIGDGFERVILPNDPITKTLDEVPKAPECLMTSI